LSSESLDPSTTGFSFLGDAAGDRFGYSVSTAGDINGDGSPDIIIGAHSKESYRGMVYVIYGGLNSSFSNFNLSQTALDPATTGFTIRGHSTGNLLGLSVNTAGDINGDKYDDIIISAYLKDSIRGEVYVIYGKETSLLTNIDLSVTPLDPASTGFTLKGYASNNFFGYSVSTSGDVNKDGFDDIIIGAFGFDSDRGAAYVIYGGTTATRTNIAFSSTTLDPASTGFMITGNAASDRLGRSVSNAGDINNDGYDDIIIGAYQKDNSRGAVYVIYGGENSSLKNIDLSLATLNPASTGFTVLGSMMNEVLGYSARTVGDVNNDGYDDIIIGGNGRGRAYIIYGGKTSSFSNIALASVTLDPAITGFMITGNSLSDNFGVSVGTAGDVNGDGYDDIIIGGSGRNSNQGIAYVFYGGETSSRAHIDLSLTALDPETMGFSITGDGIGDILGFSVSTAGDINGDEYDDVIVGASKHNSDAGAAHLVYAGIWNYFYWIVMIF